MLGDKQADYQNHACASSRSLSQPLPSEALPKARFEVAVSEDIAAFEQPFRFHALPVQHQSLGHLTK